LLAQEWDSLNAIGFTSYKQGQFEQAERSLQQALLVAEGSFGQLSNPYITSLTNLGYTQKAMGNFPAAQNSFRKTLTLLSKLDSAATIHVVEALIDLANVFNLTARYDSSEHYLLAAKQVTARAITLNSEDYRKEIHRYFEALISIQNSLASLYNKRGQLKEAIELMEQQRGFILQTYPGHYQTLPIYKTTISNLSTYYLQANQLLPAKSLSMEYLQLSSQANSDPIAYVAALQTLGNVYRLSEQYDSANHFWMKALQYIQSGNFKGSDQHLSLLINLGEFNFNIENYSLALDYLLEAKTIQEKQFGRNPRVYQTTLFNLAECYRWNDQHAKAEETYTYLIRNVLDEIQHNFTYLSDAEKIAFYRSQTSVIEHFYSFALEISGVIPLQKQPNPYINKDITQQLYDAQIMTKGLILNPSYRFKQQIISGANEELKLKYLDWEEEKNRLAQLYRSSDPAPDLIKIVEAQIEFLEKFLIAQSRQFRQGFMVDVVTWKSIQANLKRGEAAVEMIRLIDGLVYGALIITPQTTERPALTLVMSTQTKHLEKQFIRNYINTITTKQEDTLSYQTYWEPILKVINENLPKGQRLKKIYFSPDGIYHQINLNTLYNKEKKGYLIDEVEIHQLTNTKGLISSAKRQTQDKRATLIGRPAFGLDSTRAVTYQDLKGTETEVDQIAFYFEEKEWKTHVLKQTEANENNVKSLPSTKVLHIATHGFFENSVAESTNAHSQVLLNSGIVLAGANNPDKTADQDGILTAYETLSLNLDSTELVVLSACETGLGDFFPGEGVYGLQGAFRSAGVQQLIMSLWKVDDETTRHLMTTFYKHWLKKSGDARVAFRKAQQELRTRYPQPYYWGGFVFTGK